MNTAPSLIFVAPHMRKQSQVRLLPLEMPSLWGVEMIRVENGIASFRGVSPILRTSHVHVRYMALALLFTFCQVIGSMCVMPDLSESQEAAFIEDRMACPMDEAIMCPPSLTSSPERQIKLTVALNADQTVNVLCLVPLGLTGRVSPVPWSGSSVLSIVPISISSSSVLRI